MHPERWLEDVGASMRIGKVADQAVLVLAKIQTRGVVQLQDQDRDVLHQAVLFLESVKNGYAWLDQPTVSSNSRSLVSSFAAAVRSLTPRMSKEAFISVIDQMLSTLHQLEKGETQPDLAERLALTRGFFGRLASEAIDSVHSVLNRSPSPGLSSWNPANASLA